MLDHKGTEKIITSRLILRPFKYSDGESMMKYWVSFENIQRLYCEPVCKTTEELNKLLEGYISPYERKDYYRWAVIFKDSGECIGQIGFFLVDSKYNFAEMEYCIGGPFQNMGLATEAARAVIRFAFENIGFHKIQISHKAHNSASKRVIEKCGFKYEGTLRDYFFEDGVYIDRVYYSILESEYYELFKKDMG